MVEKIKCERLGKELSIELCARLWHQASDPAWPLEECVAPEVCRGCEEGKAVAEGLA